MEIYFILEASPPHLREPFYLDTVRQVLKPPKTILMSCIFTTSKFTELWERSGYSRGTEAADESGFYRTSTRIYTLRCICHPLTHPFAFCSWMHWIDTLPHSTLHGLRFIKPPSMLQLTFNARALDTVTLACGTAPNPAYRRLAHAPRFPPARPSDQEKGDTDIETACAGRGIHTPIARNPEGRPRA
ncbi:hypothetical protein MSAN_02476400 [Mycena sanguinolenta]|uniref:Uncharacterized protein n=1 Tax=Mycena sanguinolenta TaxID=230812 RepID=A0A8H6U3S2_9AGAR|nr:hypothetical protein MSAN_02476400 [Mycena sanguinolenta]